MEFNRRGFLKIVLSTSASVAVPTLGAMLPVNDAATAHEFSGSKVYADEFDSLSKNTSDDESLTVWIIWEDNHGKRWEQRVEEKLECYWIKELGHLAIKPTHHRIEIGSKLDGTIISLQVEAPKAVRELGMERVTTGVDGPVRVYPFCTVTLCFHDPVMTIS